MYKKSYLFGVQLPFFSFIEELMIDEVIEEKESLGVDDSDVTLDKELCEENGKQSYYKYYI